MCGTEYIRRQHQSGQHGFTLLEVMVSMTLLSVGLLGTVGLQVTAIKDNSFGSKATQAVTLAQSKASELLSYSFNDPRLADASTGNNPGGPTGSFTPAVSTTFDPTSAADGLDPTPIDETGQPQAGATFGNGLGFQRYWQIYPETLNASVATPSALRIRVAVRFRDDANSAHFREVSVIVWKSFNL